MSATVRQTKAGPRTAKHLKLFVRSIFFKAGINKFEISVKFDTIFFDTHIDFLTNIFLSVILTLFASFECKYEKNCTFSNILQKLKHYLMTISIIFRLIPYSKNPNKFKIEAP
jgi:hypothetical protein